MNKSGVIATIAAIVVVFVEMICTVGQDWILLAMSTASLLPTFVSLGFAFAMPKPTCQRTLCAGSVLYLAWMVFFVVYCFAINPGPLGPIAFLAGPIYSLPVMAIVWIVATTQHASATLTREQGPSN